MIDTDKRALSRGGRKVRKAWLACCITRGKALFVDTHFLSSLSVQMSILKKALLTFPSVHSMVEPNHDDSFREHDF